MAHETIVEVALKNLDIDKLIVVPTYLNPFKNSFYLEPKFRFELLKKVFSPYPNVEICDYEIKNDKVSYTYKTVSYIKSLY
ncbi:nicotinate-nicotinamide nucleotide adenylyltransferase, partial [Aliarcobacter lanthieri]